MAMDEMPHDELGDLIDRAAKECGLELTEQAKLLIHMCIRNIYEEPDPTWDLDRLAKSFPETLALQAADPYRIAVLRIAERRLPEWMSEVANSINRSPRKSLSAASLEERPRKQIMFFDVFHWSSDNFEQLCRDLCGGAEI